MRPADTTDPIPQFARRLYIWLLCTGFQFAADWHVDHRSWCSEAYLKWFYMSGHVFCSCGCWLSARKGWSVVTLCVFVCVLVARIYVLCHWKRYCHEVARTNWRWHGTKKKCVRLIAASPVEWTWLGAHNKFMMMRIVVVGGRLAARDEHKERAISNDSCC